MQRSSMQHIVALLFALLVSISVLPTHATPVMGRLALPSGANGMMSAFKNELFKDAVVSLNHGSQYQELVRVDGTFELAGVQPGLYTLTVTSMVYQFPMYKVEVKANGVVRALEDKGGQKKVIPHPLVLRPVGQPVYFEPRQQISLYSMFANPMGIMMIFTLGMVVLYPRMMKAIDPEELKKMQDDMGSTGDPNAMLKNLMGGGAADDGKESDSDSD